jgi:Protein of unknown function (DUF2891)
VPALAILLPGCVVAMAIHSGTRTTPRPDVPGLDAATAARFARLALDCVHREYPNKIAQVMQSDADARPPRELTPAFFGCYDWHSSVHGHWLLVRLAKLYPQADFVADARAALAQSLTPANIAVEVAYMRGPGRASFERPYGLAWLLKLASELQTWDDAQAREWHAALVPLAKEATQRFTGWLPKLLYPVRVGEHSQTAFALGLLSDWTVVAGDVAVAELLRERALAYYAGDRDCPISYEPSGEDFLSPCLGEADFMRRILPPREYSRWLSGFLPGIPADGSSDWLAPGVVTDRSDPKLAHIDGLNLSRAWMLEGIACGLPADDRRRSSLLAAARVHAQASLPAVTGEHYEGGHWTCPTRGGAPPRCPRGP